MTDDRTLLIFGTGDVAELAAYYFELDLGRRAAAFVVDDAYADAGTFADRPLIPSSRVAAAFDAGSSDMFIALGYGQMNRLRRQKLEWSRSLGFGSVSYISPRATVFPNVTVGANCFVLEDNTVQPFVTVGENVTLWSGNHIGHHSTIEDDVFISSHVVVAGRVHVGRGSFLGINATLRDGITIGDHSVIGAGVTILGDTAPESVYIAPRVEPIAKKSSELRGL